MTSNGPDFFPASSESYAFRDPRKCWIEAIVVGDVRTDYLLVRIDPPATDINTKGSIERILIAGKFDSSITAKFPAVVYIAKIKDVKVMATRKCSASSIEVVTSGTIFASEKDAAAFAATVA
jgi:hypothetical protein